jgi:beta-N-acetylhexosaminidase
LPRPCRRLGATVAVLALVLAACGSDGDEGPAFPPPTSEPPGSTAAPSTAATAACAPAPLAERAAATLVVGIDDAKTADAALPVELTGIGVGGVILRAENVVDAAQLRALATGLRERSPRGLLVTADEEGGRVSRLRAVVGRTESPRSLGARPLPEITEEAARRGAAMRDLGIDLVLAPVVDADGGPAGATIGDRSFSGDVAEAGVRAAAFVEGLERAGIGATLKHFPGQGAVAGDSHDGAVVSDRPRAEVEATAAAFSPGIAAGADAVLVSHATYTAVGPLPASVEPAVYQLLRASGFDGAAVTDALGMGAIVQRWPISEAAVMALTAGADVVLVNQGVEASGIRDAVVAAVEAGRLPEARLDEAVRRALALRGVDPATMVCP